MLQYKTTTYVGTLMCSKWQTRSVGTLMCSQSQLGLSCPKSTCSAQSNLKKDHNAPLYSLNFFENSFHGLPTSAIAKLRLLLVTAFVIVAALLSNVASKIGMHTNEQKPNSRNWSMFNLLTAQIQIESSLIIP